MINHNLTGLNATGTAYSSNVQPPKQDQICVRNNIDVELHEGNDSDNTHLIQRNGDEYYTDIIGKHNKRNGDEYYTDIIGKHNSGGLPGLAKTTEQEWAREINEYEKLGGNGKDLVEYIDAAKADPLGKRSPENTKIVNDFRKKFTETVGEKGLEHFGKLHEAIKAKLQEFQKEASSKDDLQKDQEYTFRIRGLSNASIQFKAAQTLAAKESERFVSNV